MSRNGQSSEEQGGGLPNIDQGLLNYGIPDHTVISREKNRPR